ncbi:hypothetical protein QKG93_14625 [Clavibacter michiganensis]|uniref:hypothetical protein n=1 Tax=Clavibacter michiganensis TaxID=28447 RepID=UPI0026DD49A7|nr:hypothetical protein [Clavibacter michiganensis]MDO4027169.1 hypothetical protein [Clavibacter michiganensis]MDO4135175.1 hypothetical protein [Clavibacter michiganensis]
MPYDSTAANVFALIGFVALVTGAVFLALSGLFPSRGRSSLTRRAVVRLLTGFGFIMLGVASYLLADLFEGRSWIPGRIIAALAWSASVATITWGGRKILHETRDQ